MVLEVGLGYVSLGSVLTKATLHYSKLATD